MPRLLYFQEAPLCIASLDSPNPFGNPFPSTATSWGYETFAKGWSAGVLKIHSLRATVKTLSPPTSQYALLIRIQQKPSSHFFQLGVSFPLSNKTKMQFLSLLPVFTILYGSVLSQYCASTTSQPFELIDLQTLNTTGGEDDLGTSISFTLNDLNGPGLQTTCSK